MVDQAKGIPAPLPPPPSAPLQAAQQVQQQQWQQQQQQDHIAQVPTAQQPGQQLIHLNWSYLKPEFSGKLDEDAKAHLLCINDWMNAHHFSEGVKVQWFCLTLLGEARLWYQS